MNNVHAITNRADGCFDIVINSDSGEFVVAKCWDSVLSDEIAETVRRYIKIEGCDPIGKDESDKMNQNPEDPFDESRNATLEAKTPVGSEYEIVSIKDVGPNIQTPYRRGKHTYDVVWTLDGEEHKIRNLTADNEEEARKKVEKMAYYTTLTFGRKNPSGEPFEVVDEDSEDADDEVKFFYNGKFLGSCDTNLIDCEELCKLMKSNDELSQAILDYMNSLGDPLFDSEDIADIDIDELYETFMQEIGYEYMDNDELYVDVWTTGDNRLEIFTGEVAKDVLVKEANDPSYVYVKFKSIPPREARTKMKMNGFRWDGKRWQAKLSHETEEVAKSMKRYGGVMEIEDNSDASLMPNNWDLDYELGY